MNILPFFTPKLILVNTIVKILDCSYFNSLTSLFCEITISNFPHDSFLPFGMFYFTCTSQQGSSSTLHTMHTYFLIETLLAKAKCRVVLQLYSQLCDILKASK